MMNVCLSVCVCCALGWYLCLRVLCLSCYICALMLVSTCGCLFGGAFYVLAVDVLLFFLAVCPCG